MRTRPLFATLLLLAAGATTALLAAAQSPREPAPVSAAVPSAAQTAILVAPAETATLSGTETATLPGAETATATASSSATLPPPLPVIHGADIPSERSERPKEAEWKGARSYSVTRGHPDRCQLSVVREWLRVVCKDSPGIGLVAGDPKGVTTWIQGDLQYLHPLAAVVELPLTRGASRIVTILDLDGGEYDGLGVGEDSQLSVTWRAGEANPVIALYQINEPFDGG